MVYPFICRRLFVLLPVLGSYEKAAANVCTGFCASFSRVHTQEWNCWVIWKYMFNIVRNCRTALPEYLPFCISANGV